MPKCFSSFSQKIIDNAEKHAVKKKNYKIHNLSFWLQT